MGNACNCTGIVNPEVGDPFRSSLCLFRESFRLVKNVLYVAADSTLRCHDVRRINSENSAQEV